MNNRTLMTIALQPTTADAVPLAQLARLSESAQLAVQHGSLTEGSTDTLILAVEDSRMTAEEALAWLRAQPHLSAAPTFLLAAALRYVTEQRERYGDRGPDTLPIRPIRRIWFAGAQSGPGALWIDAPISETDVWQLVLDLGDSV